MPEFEKEKPPKKSGDKLLQGCALLIGFMIIGGVGIVAAIYLLNKFTK